MIDTKTVSMNVALNYNDVFVRMPMGCDMTKLIALVKSMGGMAINIPVVKEKTEASVDDVFGVWSDREYPSAEDICTLLKESRTSSRKRDEMIETAWQ